MAGCEMLHLHGDIPGMKLNSSSESPRCIGDKLTPILYSVENNMSPGPEMQFSI